MTEKKECNDEKCPIHGALKTRGRNFVGEISSAKMHRTATLVLERRHYIPKYRRYEKKRTTLKAHNPDCIAAKEGDIVRVSECRPLSKTKGFAIIEVIERA